MKSVSSGKTRGSYPHHRKKKKKKKKKKYVKFPKRLEKQKKDGIRAITERIRTYYTSTD